jgi:hypothetical protein
MLLFDFCNRLARHVHLAESSDARGDASACAAAARPSETNPRRATRVMRCLTTPRELWSSSFTLRRPHEEGDEGRARADPAGPRSRDPRSAPPGVRRCLPRTGRAPLPLTPLRRRARHRGARPPLGSSYPPIPSRTEAQSAPGAPSIAGCPLTRTRHRPQGFATLDRLPTLFRRPGPDFRGVRGLDRRFPWRSSRPGALDHASSVDFCHRIDPQARPADLRYPSWVWTPGLRRAPASRSVRGFLPAHPHFTGAVRRPRSRVSLGQGPLGGAALALGSRRPLAAMARVRGFAPTQSTRTPLVARPTHGQAGVA